MASDSYGLTDTSWNLGDVATGTSLSDHDSLGGAFATPNTTGTATAANPAVPSNSFLRQSNLRAARSLMIRTIRFLRSAPVTPDRQARGDPTQNSHVLKRLRA